MSTAPGPAGPLDVAGIQQVVPNTLTTDERVALAASMECGIKTGKLRPFVAIGIARKLNVPLAAWISAQAKQFEARTGKP